MLIAIGIIAALWVVVFFVARWRWKQWQNSEGSPPDDTRQKG
ncbi:hypothetical protein LCGC14_0894360 [marine sediment metagenome]|uniref:Uncharacterized protein n=1 Tax=marine sediment metagenome TaxID=412755 RepID=A0A0F9RHK1_9ZZZZ